MRVLPLIASIDELLEPGNIDLVKEYELVFEKQTHRAFVGDYERVIAPVDHGSVADESEMIALFEGPRGCYFGDTCYREDTETTWLCISSRGLLVGHWRNLGVTRQSSFADFDSSGLPGSISNPPTQAEVQSILTVFNQLVTNYNTLLSRFRVTGGNGLFED